MFAMQCDKVHVQCKQASIKLFILDILLMKIKCCLSTFYTYDQLAENL